MSVTIHIDKGSADHLNKQFKLLQDAGPRSVYSAIVKVAYAIASEASLRLKGQGHVVTGRLKNSIFVKTTEKARQQYQDDSGQQFTAELLSVAVAKEEVAIGTNVQYAQKIENRFPFLSWAVLNVNVNKSIGEQAKANLENVMKFGPGILPAQPK